MEVGWEHGEWERRGDKGGEGSAENGLTITSGCKTRVRGREEMWVEVPSASMLPLWG